MTRWNGNKMIVVAEFEKPTKCEDCPCFYKTEGAFYDECAEKLTKAKELLKRWVDAKVTVSEQKDLIADTEQFLEEIKEK